MQLIQRNKRNHYFYFREEAIFQPSGNIVYTSTMSMQMTNLEVFTKQGAPCKRQEMLPYSFVNRTPVTVLFKYAPQICVFSN